MTISREEAEGLDIAIRVAAYATERGIAAEEAVWELAEFGLAAVCEERLLSAAPLPIYLYRSYRNLVQTMRESANDTTDPTTDTGVREAPRR